ncbi:acyl-CoA thioesterase/BAAT N-terminal domain-containing protein [Leifsonia aquatica]|uniref:acyl-CoA thioesterase/BAAT N-terminal domain-containing protein n=1 Tax=Leifsonia aquatica TaxID=144185 RepID=UPI0004683466|nr:acyl-CoA thioesterase/BAAT N-terminal domain-containing protein [Leifsonia aquatica]
MRRRGGDGEDGGRRRPTAGPSPRHPAPLRPLRRRPWARRGPVRRRSAAIASAAAAAAIVLVLSGCSTAASGAAGPRFVTPPLIHYTSVLWPVPLELVGAQPGSRLRIAASLTTERGTWRSSATYTVPAGGVLDLASARPQLAPFAEPDSVGLFWSLAGPELSGASLATQWMHDTLPVRFSAVDGDRVVAARTFSLQGLADGLRPHTLYTRDLLGASALPRETHEDQPVAQFWSAASQERPVTPAVLMFDDPSPGASSAFVAPLLARFGASVLVLPVSSAPDGVRAASVVDSTTVADALAWLGDQQGIDARQVFVYGTGVSEPLALWAATRFPTRLHGLFAAGGAPQLLCLPSGSTAPAFEDGAGLPCRVEPGPVSASAVLPLRDVNGPVVLACGDRDAVLPSACAGQQALVSARGVRAGDSLLRSHLAGHAVTVPPGLPVALADSRAARGGGGSGADAQATEQARIAFWNAVAQIVLRAART